MRRITMACLVCVSVLTLDTALFAQSGSRNRPQRTRRTPSLEQTRLLQQQNRQQQQAAAHANRIATLQSLANNRTGAENRRQYADAFKQAKREFMAIKRKELPISGRRLDQLYVLKSQEVSRTTRSIRWPKILKSELHSGLVKAIESGLMQRELTTGEVHDLLGQLSVQLEQRVIGETIEIKAYADAKRFISGLANEAEL